MHGVFNLGGERTGSPWARSATCISIMKRRGDGLRRRTSGFLVGLAVSGIWEIPGLLKILRGLNEMIVSIMLNYVALYLMGYVYTDLLREAVLRRRCRWTTHWKLMRFSTVLRYTGASSSELSWRLFLLMSFTARLLIPAACCRDEQSRIEDIRISCQKTDTFFFIISGRFAGLRLSGTARKAVPSDEQLRFGLWFTG